MEAHTLIYTSAFSHLLTHSYILYYLHSNTYIVTHTSPETSQSQLGGEDLRFISNFGDVVTTESPSSSDVTPGHPDESSQNPGTFLSKEPYIISSHLGRSLTADDWKSTGSSEGYDVESVGRVVGERREERGREKEKEKEEEREEEEEGERGEEKREEGKGHHKRHQRKGKMGEEKE